MDTHTVAAVVPRSRSIARVALQVVIGTIVVVATAYSAIRAKEARALPALAAVEQVIPDAEPSRLDRPRAISADVLPGLSSPSENVDRASSDTEAAFFEGSAPEELTPALTDDPLAADPTVRWFDGRPIRPVRQMWMTVTGYSPDERSCGDSADGLTATLHSVYTNGARLVAADPRILPYGSMVSVPGYDTGFIVPVLDCGSAIKGRRLDVLFATHEQARDWGVRRLLVTVWAYADGKPAENPRKMR